MEQQELTIRTVAEKNQLQSRKVKDNRECNVRNIFKFFVFFFFLFHIYMNNGKEVEKGSLVSSRQKWVNTHGILLGITQQRLQPWQPQGTQWSGSNCKRHMGTREECSHLYADLLFEPTFQA